MVQNSKLTLRLLR